MPPLILKGSKSHSSISPSFIKMLFRSSYLIVHSKPTLSFLTRIILRCGPFTVRSFSSSSLSTPPVDGPLPARWLTDIKSRIGKCIIFGLQPAQIDEAGSILRILARDWRELLAGTEGFLVGSAGLEGHNVVWGDMVNTSSAIDSIGLWGCLGSRNLSTGLRCWLTSNCAVGM